MTYIIPTQDAKKFSQPNDGQLDGNIFVTKNIDFRQKGLLKLTRGVLALMSIDDNGNFDISDSIFPSATEAYFLSDEVFSKSSLGVSVLTSHSGDTNRPQPGTEEDGEYFNGTEVISDGANIKYQSAPGVWTTVALTLSTSNPTSLNSWSGAGVLAVGNKNTVKFVSTGWVLSGTVLTIPAEYIITGISSNGSTLYIATRHKGNGIAQLFVVGSVKTSADASYPVGTFELFAIRAYKASIVGINSRGQLLYFNGGGFQELAHFPSINSRNEWADSLNQHSRVSTRGIAVDGDRVYIRYDSSFQTKAPRFDNYFPGGVACYDPAIGLYHYMSPTYTKIIHEFIDAPVDVDLVTNIISSIDALSSAPPTGTPIIYDSGGGAFLTPLLEETTYYVIKVGTHTIKLASSYTNALAGTAIDLLTTGSNLGSFYYFPINDFGWAYAGNKGGIAALTSGLMDGTYGDRIVFTALVSIIDNTGFELRKTVACMQNPILPNRGYFITPRLNSVNIQDIYDCFALKYKTLKPDDQFIVKYKTRDRIGLPINRVIDSSLNFMGIWTSTTTFTTTRDLSAVLAGDEVEVLAGVGAGFLAHLTVAPVLAAGVYTVTLDEAFPWANSGDCMYFAIDNWKKVATITASSEDAAKGYFRQELDEAQDKFIQFKVELRGFETALEEFQVGNRQHIPLS